jgi:hypothetical protein
MSAHVIFHPLRLNAGLAGPGETTQPVFVAADVVPIAARVSTNIVDDTSSGGFRIVSLESTIVVDVDPDDPDFPIPKGSHPKGKTIKVLASSDGSHPIDIAQGSTALVTVVFKAPDPPSADSSGSYSATLNILADTWDPITIPMVATSAGIVAHIVTPAISGVQGQGVSAQIEARSAAGPATDVLYEVSGGKGITLIPNPTIVHIDKGTQVTSPLAFAIALDGPLGTQSLDIGVSAFNGQGRARFQSVAITVLPGNVSVRLSQEAALHVRPGQVGQISVLIAAEGATVDVTLEPADSPAGFKLSSTVVQIPAQSSRIVAVAFAVDRSAPTVVDGTVAIKWTAADGEHSGLLTTTLSIKPETKCFASGNLGPSTVTGSASLCMNSDGYFLFTGQVRENGFLGHKYGFLMALDVEDQSGNGIGWANSGTVGGTTDPFDSRDDSWTQQNFDQRIVDHWDIIKVSQAQATLHVNTDAVQVLEAVVEACLAELAVRLVVAAIVLLATNPEVVVAFEPVVGGAGGIGGDLVIIVPIH